MRRVEDRRGHQRAVDAAVRDGEGAALHFGHRQFAVAGAEAKLGDLLFNGGKAHLIGVAHDGNHKPIRRADGDAHMDEVLVDDIGAVDLGIDLGHFLQGMAAGLGEERHEAKFDAVFLFEQLLVFLAQPMTADMSTSL